MGDLYEALGIVLERTLTASTRMELQRLRDQRDAPTQADRMAGMEIQRILPDLHYEGPVDLLGWVAGKVTEVGRQVDE